MIGKEILVHQKRTIAWKICFLGLTIASVAFSGFSHAKETVCERILLLKEDGKNYIAYETIRSAHQSYNLFLSKKATLDPYLYIYPNEYKWDTTSDAASNILRFNQGSYATLKPGTLESKITIDKEGIFTFRSWDKKKDKKRPDGHFGAWNTPDHFKHYVYCWVLPEMLEVVDYHCNRVGKWVKRNNTLTFFGKEVNDLVFRIRYRHRSAQTLQALTKSIGKEKEIQVRRLDGYIQVSLPNKIAFDPGRSELSKKGKELLYRIAISLNLKQTSRIVVDGHTDNTPVQGSLKKKFASNWELSAHRALAVVRFLQVQGVPGKRLEARAFGEYRPVSSNKTKEGKAANRRIELLIVEESKNIQADPNIKPRLQNK